MADTVAKRNLNRLQESATRNLLVMVLQLRNEKFFNKNFFTQRQFYKESIHDDACDSMLDLTYAYFKKFAGNLSPEENCLKRVC
jgi:hypothetical protein